MYFTEMLIPKIESACSNAWGNYSGHEKRNTFRRGFLLGCVSGIGAKLYEQQVRMEYENNSMTALIRVSGTELKEYVEEVVGPTKQNKKAGKTRKSGESKILGFEAGQKMEMTKGLGNSDKGNAGLLN